MSRTKKKPTSRRERPELVEYNNKLIADRLARKFPGMHMEDIGKIAPVTAQTLKRIVNKQNVSIATLRDVTNFLDLAWHAVFDPKLTERQFHRAVVNGDSRSGR